MNIILKKTKELKKYINNAKLHPKWQVEQISKSIQEFGFNDPIAIDENNIIIEGHGRLEASIELGIEEIPCIILSHLTEEQKKAYILVHNKLTMNTGFDAKKLNQEIDDINLNLEFFDLKKIELEEVDDIEIVNDEDINEKYNITIQCNNISEAEELKKRLNIDLDLTRQILKVKYKDVRL